MKFNFKWLLFSVFSVLFLAGCMGGGAGNIISGITGAVTNNAAADNSDDSESDDQNRTRIEGTLIGMGVGALAGNLIGNDTGSTLIGAAVGGGVGYLVANEVARRKKEYQTQEELIAAESARTAEFTEEAKAINKQLKQEIGLLKRSVKTLQQQVKQGKVKESSLKAQQAAVEKRHEEAQEALTAVEKELEVTSTLYEEAQAAPKPENKRNLARWNTRIQQLKEEKNELQAHTQQLEAVSSSIAV